MYYKYWSEAVYVSTGKKIIFENHVQSRQVMNKRKDAVHFPIPFINATVN